MKKENPLVTVIIAIYNDLNFFPYAIDSILKQDYKDIEIIVVDDCSNDETKNMLKEYECKNSDLIKIVTLKKNQGDGERARNYGFKYAKGKYIAIIDSDDISYPDRLKKQVKFLEKNKDVFLVGGQAVLIDEKGKKIGERILATNFTDIKNNMYRQNNVINPSIMFRNCGFSKFYKIKFPIFNDYYTFASLISEGKKIVNLPDLLIKYRVNNSSATFSKIKEKYKTNMVIKKFIRNELKMPVTLLDMVSVYMQYILVLLLPEQFIFNIYKRLMLKK